MRVRNLKKFCDLSGPKPLTQVLKMDHFTVHFSAQTLMDAGHTEPL